MAGSPGAAEGPGRVISLLLCAWLVLSGCSPAAEYRRYGGTTMGTYYQVTARCPDDVGEAIRDELASVNGEMSTYLPDSLLSRLNGAPAGQWVAVDPSLAEVLAAAGRLYRESGGAFDVSVGPLVNLWGFGPDQRSGMPSAAEVASTRSQVGFQHLEIRHDPPAVRKNQALYLDLSAIAKGHGVDRVAGRLLRTGCDALLVDVGGEVTGRGDSPSSRPWRIGVEVPDPESNGHIQRVVQLQDAAVATSGDYRNFFEYQGRRYSHTIDPRTGRPVEHELASVTVVHESAMWADGYATLLEVLGPQQGMAFAEQQGLAALFVLRTPTGFEERYTEPMGQLLVE